MRSSGRSPAWAAGEPGITSSMYGGVASTGFATSLIPVNPAYSSFFALSWSRMYSPFIPFVTKSRTETVTVFFFSS